MNSLSLIGFVAAVSIYLAFIPPERYVRFVRSHA
jgi:hypothetical protein